MKIVQVERLIDSGRFSKSDDWRKIESQLVQAIKSVQWPPGSGAFTLHDQSGKARGEGSGVKPIKDACMLHLKSVGWSLETHVDVATLKQPGPMDATIRVRNRLFCVEWETGNIYFSHCPMNWFLEDNRHGFTSTGSPFVPDRSSASDYPDRNLSKLDGTSIGQDRWFTNV